MTTKEYGSYKNRDNKHLKQNIYLKCGKYFSTENKPSTCPAGRTYVHIGDRGSRSLIFGSW